MKKFFLVTLTLLLSLTSFSQCLSVLNRSKSHPFPSDRYNSYTYLDGSIDINNAFNVFESNSEPQGLDFDIELGERKGMFGYYVFYGNYSKIEYHNFGAGVDYYVLESRAFDISAGLNLGGIKYSGDSLNIPGRDEATYFAYAVRVRPTLDLTNTLSLTSRVQYQHTPYRDMHGIFEVAAGLMFKIF